jgi:hypothetical protein
MEQGFYSNGIAGRTKSILLIKRGQRPEVTEVQLLQCAIPFSAGNQLLQGAVPFYLTTTFLTYISSSCLTFIRYTPFL